MSAGLRHFIEFTTHTRGQRLAKAKAIHYKLGSIYKGRQKVDAESVSRELTLVHEQIKRLQAYKANLVNLHDYLIGQSKTNPETLINEKRSFFGD